MVDSIHSVGSGKNIIYPDSAPEIHRKSFTQTEREELMTEREIEIIKTIAAGRSSKEIAKMLFISPFTVDVHKRNILKKLGANKAVEITKYAIRSSILVL